VDEIIETVKHNFRKLNSCSELIRNIHQQETHFRTHFFPNEYSKTIQWKIRIAVIAHTTLGA